MRQPGQDNSSTVANDTETSGVTAAMESARRHPELTYRKFHRDNKKIVLAASSATLFKSAGYRRRGLLGLIRT
jgi:hypothetical protein